jgi:GR25 family glycosyltransferase involved in LPS biosynthesis
MVEENIEAALILEDDVTFDKNFIQKFNEYYSHVPCNWDMILLGCTMLCRSDKTLFENIIENFIYFKGNTSVNNYVNRIVSFTGLHAYILRLETAKRFINEASKEINDYIELQLSSYINKNSDLNVYAFQNYLVTQNLLLYESVNNTSRSPNLINMALENISLYQDDDYKISWG